MLVENLTYPGVKAAAALLGLKLAGVAIDAHGLVPDALAAGCRTTGAKALYCMPSLHNPTAAVMPEARRREIAAIAARHDMPIIEDDCYGFLVPDAPPPMAALGIAEGCSSPACRRASRPASASATSPPAPAAWSG